MRPLEAACSTQLFAKVSDCTPRMPLESYVHHLWWVSPPSIRRSIGFLMSALFT